jgi:hypothetical protein
MAAEDRTVLRLGVEVEAGAWEFGIASTLRGVPAVRPMVEALRYCAEVKSGGEVAQERYAKDSLGALRGSAEF